MRRPNGQPVNITLSLTDLTKTLVDAGTLTLTLTKPDGTQQTYSSPTHDSTGKYHQLLAAADLTQNGHYLYWWTATGTGAGTSVTGTLDVFDPAEPRILSLEDAKTACNIKSDSTTYDDELDSLVDTVTDQLERITGGPLFNRSVTERVEISNDYRALVLRKRPVVSVTSITDVASGFAMGTTDLDIDPVTCIVRRKRQLPFWSWGPYYTVVYVAGWGTVMPAAFGDAARIIVNHLWQQKRGPNLLHQTAGLDATVLPGMSYAIPNRASELMSDYALEVYV